MFVKIIGLFLTAVTSLLFTLAVYRAYVVIQPCTHSVPKQNAANRLNITQEQIERFQRSLRIPTISIDYNLENLAAKAQHLDFIRSEYKHLEAYGYVKVEIVNKYSILYKIQGTETNLPPYLWAAHSDVVPVEEGEHLWTHKPFAADLAEDGNIYARGTMDDKSSLLAQLEAVTKYLAMQGQPKRTLYLAFGHDEEITGYNGAGVMADMLKGQRFEYVLDEGTIIVDKLLTGITRPVAPIGIADKGYLTVKYYANTTGGHSSMPRADSSAIFIISNALSRIRENPFPSKLGEGPETQLFEALSVNLGFLERVFLANIWLFKPILKWMFERTATMDALQRTTTAPTIIRAGSKDNVVPSYAEVTVNYRIHSTQSCLEVVNYHMNAINDPRVQYEILQCIEPSPVSPTDSLGFTVIEHSTRQIYEDAIIIPGIMLGLTDSRFYNNLTSSVYKYLPMRIDNEDLKRYHGVDERISVVNYERLINFYFCLLANTDGAHLVKEKEIHTEF